MKWVSFLERFRWDSLWGGGWSGQVTEVLQAFQVGVTGEVVDAPAKVESELGGEGGADFGMGGEPHHLMASLREVLFHQGMTAFWVEAIEGGVDRHGELPTRGLGQAPEQGDREDRFFSGREGGGVRIQELDAGLLAGGGLGWSVVELDRWGAEFC